MTSDSIRASRMWVTPLDDSGEPTGPRREVTTMRSFSFDLDMAPVTEAWQRLTEAFVDVIAATTRFAGAVAARYAIERLGVTEADIRHATLTGVTLWNGRRIPIDTHHLLAWARGKDHHA